MYFGVYYSRRKMKQSFATNENFNYFKTTQFRFFDYYYYYYYYYSVDYLVSIFIYNSIYIFIK